MGGMARAVETDLSGTVASAVAGDDVAFERIIAAHHEDMRRVCLVMCHDDEIAEEAVQSAWAIAWRKLDTLDAPHQRTRPTDQTGPAREGRPSLVRLVGVDSETRAATMVETPTAEWGMKGTVADKGSAFRQLADEHLDASYALASAILRDPTEARDAVHDAFLTAWRKWDTLRDPGSFPWWFRRILVNTCRDRLRRVTRHPTMALPAEPILLSGDPTGIVHDHAVLDRAFAVLSADDKVVLILRYFLDLPADDIARLLDVRPGTVGSRLNRAQARLREALTEPDQAEVIS